VSGITYRFNAWAAGGWPAREAKRSERTPRETTEAWLGDRISILISVFNF